MRGFLLIGFAVIIDFVQAMLMFAFVALEFITPVGGGFTGALAAGWYCWSISTGIFSGIYNGASCALAGGVVGAGASAFAIPLGMAVDVGISITFGGALVLALAYMGAFYPGPVISAFIGESIPLLDLFPGWTLMTWRCLARKKAEEKNARGQTGSGAAFLSFAGVGTTPREKEVWALEEINAIRVQNSPLSQVAQAQKSAARAPMLTLNRQVDGIRNAKTT